MENQYIVRDIDPPFAVDQEISSDEYEADFREICEIVKDHYSLGELKGIDLNSLNQRYQAEVSKAVKIKEYYQAVCSYFASLKNLHTNLLYKPYYIPATAEWRNNHLYVVLNLSQYPLKGGDRILSIDGMDVQVWRDSIMEYVTSSTDRARRLRTAKWVFQNPIDSVQQLCLSRHDSVFNVTVRLDRKIQNQINITPEEGHSKQREEKQVEKNISRIEIIQLKDFKDNSTEKFKKDHQSKKESPVLVINLSNNPGGLGKNAERIVSLFLKQPYQGTHQLINPVKEPYSGKLYVMITHNTRSSAELLASILKESGVAVLVGEETAGDFGTYRETFKTSYGTCFSLGIGIPSLTMNGNPTEGVGVKPDYTIDEQEDECIPKNNH